MRPKFTIGMLILSLSLFSLTSCAYIGAATGGAAGFLGARAAGANNTWSAVAAAGGAVIGWVVGDSIQGMQESSEDWKKLKARSKTAGTATTTSNGDGSYIRHQTYLYRDETGTPKYFDAHFHYDAPKGARPPELDHIDVDNWRDAVEAEGQVIDESKPVQAAPAVNLPGQR